LSVVAYATQHPMSSPLRLWSPLTQPVYKLNEYEIYSPFTFVH